MIELVPMAYRVVNEVDAVSASADDRVYTKDNESVKTVASTKTVAVGSRRMDEDEERDAVFFRLESLGYRVGQGLVER